MEKVEIIPLWDVDTNLTLPSPLNAPRDLTHSNIMNSFSSQSWQLISFVITSFMWLSTVFLYGSVWAGRAEIKLQKESVEKLSEEGWLWNVVFKYLAICCYCENRHHFATLRNPPDDVKTLTEGNIFEPRTLPLLLLLKLVKISSKQGKSYDVKV